jgi:hypothetical protein
MTYIQWNGEDIKLFVGSQGWNWIKKNNFTEKCHPMNMTTVYREYTLLMCSMLLGWVCFIFYLFYFYQINLKCGVCVSHFYIDTVLELKNIFVKFSFFDKSLCKAIYIYFSPKILIGLKFEIYQIKGLFYYLVLK